MPRADCIMGGSRVPATAPSRVPRAPAKIRNGNQPCHVVLSDLSFFGGSHGKDLIGNAKGNPQTGRRFGRWMEFLREGKGHQKVADIDDQLGQSDFQIAGRSQNHRKPCKLTGRSQVGHGNGNGHPNGKPSGDGPSCQR